MPLAQEKDTVRIPLVGLLQNRDGTTDKDQLYFNCMFEDNKNDMTSTKKLFVQKRPGLTVAYNQTDGEGRGGLFWDATDKFYYVIGSALYANNTNIGTIGTSTGSVGFMECYEGSAFTLFLCDGTNGYLISTSDVVTAITVGNFPADGNGYTGADFPTGHVPKPAFMDGYIFLVQEATGKVFNSKLTDPGRWRAASDYVTPIIYSDKATALARQANQLVVFKEQTTEMYYDQGQSGATGSPLGRTEQAALQVGCSSYGSVAQNERLVIWVGKSHVGGAAVWEMDGFTNNKISTSGVEKLIQAETNLGAVKALFVRTKGSFMYILNLPTLDKTLVYDVDEKSWMLWGYTDYQDIDYRVNWDFGDESASQTYYVLGRADGIVYELDPEAYTDNGIAIKTLLRTSKMDFDNSDRKFMHKLTIVGDTQMSSSPILVQWTDDDYQTYSVGQQVDMREGYAVCYRLGWFRRRAIQLTHTAPTPLRLEHLEVYYKQGVN